MKRSNSSAPHLVQHFLPQTYSKLQRQEQSHLLIGSSCGIWLSYIVLTEHSGQAIAWVFLLASQLLASISRWLSVRQELTYRLEPLFQPVFETPLRPATTQKTEDLELDELVAPIIALVSIALPIVLLTSYLIFHIDLSQLQKPIMRRQIVDIELVAPTDAIDRKDVLPSTSKEIATKAHKGALYTVSSQALHGAPIKKLEAVTKSKPIAKTETVSEEQAKDKSNAFSTDQKSQAFLSEVEPANMIESIDSDGQLSPLTVQSGGRSSSGNGAPSDLHEYLKLLNKRVKSHWLPPSGIDRIAIIQFRIAADGKLLSTITLPHSGAIDHEAEAAAIAAINKSFPHKPLPHDVHTTYLDVQYTFNYRFNAIEAVD